MPDNETDPRLAMLVDGIVRLSRGDLSTRMEPSAARDDVDAVITGFNLLAEELELVHRDFEDRVESRTAMLHQAHLDMRAMAMTDALTQLDNRIALLAKLEDELAADGDATPPALILLDLDSFKDVNDSFGHDAGDRVLQEVANRLVGVIRDTDTVARLGGDEFAILVPEATLEIALRIANRALAALGDRISLDELHVFSRASIGVRLAEPGQSPESILLDADTAMYVAKREGRSTIKVFEPVMLLQRQLRSQIASELRDAIRSDQLSLHYQPVVDLRDGRVLGLEALVRWNHPTRGFIMPDEFIPLAEEIGAVIELDRWVMASAIRQYSLWRAEMELDDDFQLRLNLSAVELQQLDLVDYVRGLLRRFDIPPVALVLEITETALVTGGEVETYSLLSLKQLGVCIEIDDFGTGYSSISYLRKLPVSMVKVDRSLLSELSTGSIQFGFIAAILQLIRAAGLEAVFEGIETLEQAEKLKEMGCVGGQGYYFSKPLTVEDTSALLRSSAKLPLAS
ncbi:MULTISPECIES: putative bifunctional diguanylate cyclase/phosphodiesterase [unclassified Arthrobacter]|uniref:putative bifunctional diguanylate cyclase/phosphodiesterase n=1 Tax=unclassified Arthrobacter TaxID=235627 RepID=UPI0002FB61A8|nr:MULTISPECIES: EAL domain-containing protein [unclassified Arthrobacter]PVE15648.1 GGDEF domain-containing protein [Arthrobacter sp. Bz4]